MLLLTSTSDLVQVITGSASTINVHASYMDNASGTITPLRTNTATITTATTTTVVSSPAASTQRNVRHLNIRNVDAANATALTVQHTDGTNVEPLFKCTLLPGEELTFTQGGLWMHYDVNGGVYQGTTTEPVTYNSSTAAQGAGFASDTYVTGSSILIPSIRPKVGTLYHCKITATKTAAGTATPIVQLRYGTTASTSDTSLCSFTFSAGTAATDTGMFEVYGLYRSVGSATSAVVQGYCSLISQPTTGFSSLLKGVATTSAGHDSTTVNTYLGVSINGGASASWTVQLVQATFENYL